MNPLFFSNYEFQLSLGLYPYCIFPKNLSHDLDLLYEGVSNNLDYGIDKTLYSFLTKNNMLISTVVNDKIIDNHREVKEIDYSYSSIANVIIEWSEENHKSKSKISQGISSIGAKQLVILIYDDIQISQLEDFISCFVSSRVQNIDLYLNISTPTASSSLNRLIDKYQRINNLIVFDTEDIVPDLVEIHN